MQNNLFGLYSNGEDIKYFILLFGFFPVIGKISSIFFCYFPITFFTNAHYVTFIYCSSSIIYYFYFCFCVKTSGTSSTTAATGIDNRHIN